MNAIDRLDAWLRISPSTVLPSEVLEYLDDIKAENAKLRDDLEIQREVVAHNTNRNAREYKRVCDKNEKLQELASDMLTCIKAHRDKRSVCWKCPHHKNVDELRSACFIVTDAFKLGVMVNE